MKISIKFLIVFLLVLTMTGCKTHDNIELDDVAKAYNHDNMIQAYEKPEYITIQGMQLCILESEVSLRTSDLTREDLESLRYMTNLTHLSLGSGSMMAVMDYFLHAEGEENNHYSDYALDVIPLDITPLSVLTNLTHLELTGTLIFDISPLSDLTNLTMLNLEINGISDLTPLEGLINLTSLDIGVNPIVDLAPLSSLTNLKTLTLCGFLSNTTFGLQPLEALTSLENLMIRSRQLTCSDITSIGGLENLVSLDLSYNQIRDLTPLRSLTNLEALSVDSNQINDVSPLTSLINLDIFSIGNNQVNDISALANFQGDSFLWLQGNPITDWSPVEHIGLVIGRPSQ